MKEKDLYGPIKTAFEKFYSCSYKNCFFEITSEIYVKDFISKYQLTKFYPDYQLFLIKVDICGIVQAKKQKKGLVIIEIKKSRITVDHISQILGYSKIILPAEAWIISPKGWTNLVENIAKFRKDILKYKDNKYVKLAKFDVSSQTIKPGEILS